ncbi:MAG: signal peptidase II [Roseburia sp.]|nr:signal peptidase II [Roseburia sp.]
MRENMILKKGLIGLCCSVLLVVLDQLTKAAAVAHLKDQEPYVIWKGVFELSYLENRGMAFGMFQNKQMVFIVLTVLVMIVLSYVYLMRIPAERRFFWLNLIAILFFAGAIGNLIDRVLQNYVVDFFYFVLIDFPIFNVADIYVTVAAFLFLVLGLFYYKDADYERLSRGGKDAHGNI